MSSARASVGTLLGMEREELLEAILLRGGTACEHAAVALRRGIRMNVESTLQDPKALCEHFSANDNDGSVEDDVLTFGHQDSMAALRGSSLAALQTVLLEDMPFERWFVHLDPRTGTVVACHGIVLVG